LIETAIYVLIGALSAALVFLLAIPAVSRRAHRLAQRRAALAAPLSATEARADRDALRARHAIDVALIERRAAAAQTQWAQAQIELGRQAAALVARDAALADSREELARRASEQARLSEQLRDRDAEISAREVALFDLSGQRDAAERQQAETLERMKERQHRFDVVQADMESRIAALSRELSEERRDSEAALAAAQARVAELRRRLEESEAAIERMKDDGSPFDAPAVERLPRAHALGDPPSPLDATREQELSLRVQELMTAGGEAQAALRAARLERDALVREAAELRDRLLASETQAGALKEADGLLRQAIARLGREMVAGQSSRAAPPEREPASTL
jgi:DNA repair exonuclease SbcCD ATPase subunit